MTTPIRRVERVRRVILASPHYFGLTVASHAVKVKGLSFNPVIVVKQLLRSVTSLTPPSRGVPGMDNSRTGAPHDVHYDAARAQFSKGDVTKIGLGGRVC